ncbi:MAG: hypothetical protein ACOYK6_08660, partial [Chthoniobacterales bacterium]
MKKYVFLSLLLLALCWLFLNRGAHRPGSVTHGIGAQGPMTATSTQQPAQLASANSHYASAPVASAPTVSSSHGLASSFFSGLLGKHTKTPTSFLPYPAAPLQELSEREATDFPGARV